MENNLIPLSQLPIGTLGKVKKLIMEGSKRRRMLDLGLVYNTVVKPIIKSPAGDPIAYEIRGAIIALRSEESSKIFIKPINKVGDISGPNKSIYR